jgi:hypothetical protein
LISAKLAKSERYKIENRSINKRKKKIIKPRQADFTYLKSMNETYPPGLLSLRCNPTAKQGRAKIQLSV